jgi:hypothetical protein
MTSIVGLGRNDKTLEVEGRRAVAAQRCNRRGADLFVILEKAPSQLANRGRCEGQK